ncbi:hypothetical protein TSOC_011062, partial [Tetrabaena socialis]
AYNLCSGQGGSSHRPSVQQKDALWAWNATRPAAGAVLTVCRAGPASAAVEAGVDMVVERASAHRDGAMGSTTPAATAS